MPKIPIHQAFKLVGDSFRSPIEIIKFVKESFPEHAGFLEDLFDDNDFIIVRTSGSTGRAKKIKIRKDFLINSAQITIDFFNIKPCRSALINLSSQYIAGKLMWVRALTGGWHIDVCAPDNNSIAEKLANNTYDFGAMVPLQVYQNLDNIHHIKKLIIGGGQVSGKLLKQIQHLPNQIFATYGMTETLTHIAVMPLNIIAKQNFTEQKAPVDAYRILQGVEIATDNRNCLTIEAPDIFEGKVITNDIVELLDNKHFRWLGRFDNVINSGGIKLIPEQIENKLKQIIDFDFFIAGLPDEKLGQKVVLIIETEQIPKTLPDKLKTLLSKYEIPKNIYAFSKFERTGTGKIIRQKTLMLAESRTSTGSVT